MSNDGARKVIMVVDDDTDIRAVVSSVLTGEGYAVIEAKDGRLAEAMFAKQPPDTIISDIRMPHLDGLQLLDSVRKTSQVPFILMTGFSEIMETQQAQKLGATDFILKPFRRDEMLSVLAIALATQAGPLKSVEDDNLDMDYCRLSVDDFISGKVSLVDIYIRLSERKYVRVARGGSERSLDRINSYKARGMDFLYIKKEDFAKYIGFNLELTSIVNQKNKVTKPQKVRMLKHTTEIILQDCYVNGADKAKLESSRALVEAIVSTLSEDSDIHSLLEILQSHADHLYSHSLGVSLYSSMLAKSIGWTSGPTQFKIAMGGLLHGIGKKEISNSILEKPRQNLNNAEREIYETHPLRGKEILSLIPSVPSDVVQIAMHHHENSIGRGFPYRLMKNRIHPMAKLINVANEFCELILKSPGSNTVLTPHQALERLWNLKREEIDLSFLKALMDLFQFPIPKDMPKSALPVLL